VVIFLDRQVELALLRRELKRRGFGLLVIYGRRRVGKTALVLKATEDMRRLYYLAVERGNLPRLKRAAMALDPQARYVEEDWEALFAFLAQRVDVVVIDEFPNLIAEDKAVLSTLQAVVDQVLSGTNMKLVLVGSSVSVMTSRVLSYKSPLYGRKTLAMHVKPVPFLEYRRFFPERPAEELVEIHGFAGGIPHYMLKIGKPFWQFLDAELREKTFILDEGDFHLRYEFEDVSTYKLILEAVAAGRGTLGEIRDYARLKATDITPYLRNLAQAGRRTSPCKSDASFRKKEEVKPARSLQWRCRSAETWRSRRSRGSRRSRALKHTLAVKHPEPPVRLLISSSATPPTYQTCLLLYCGGLLNQLQQQRHSLPMAGKNAQTELRRNCGCKCLPTGVSLQV
jgi:AAA+ ATPase superfamily predicted ATPase